MDWRDGASGDGGADEVERLAEAAELAAAPEVAGVARVDLEGDEAVVAVAGERGLAGQDVRLGAVGAPDDVAQVDVAQEGADDLVAGEEVFAIGAGVGGV